MRRISMLFALLVCVFACQGQVTVNLERYDNGFTRTIEKTTYCTVHNEGDSVIFLSDTIHFNSEAIQMFQQKFADMEYVQVLEELTDCFDYEIVEYTIHSAILRKTVKETYHVEYARYTCY